MKNILVLGAGRSSSSLISYLLNHASENGWKVIVGDASLELARQKVPDHSAGTAVAFDVHNEKDVTLINSADAVISLLPAFLHPIVAQNCLKYRKHLLTASYVSEEMRQYDESARSSGLAFINECGLDPGIDHMSAMKIIDHIRNDGGKILSFESFTGGLISPDTSRDNPWRYKFTWNPRNVVMAGQGTAKFLDSGKYKYIPYQQLFTRTTAVHVEPLGDFEGYANRDSLKYIDTYNLQGIQTMLRGTLRNKGFCQAWNVFVQLGCCDDSYEIDGLANMTHVDFITCFLPGVKSGAAEQIRHLFGETAGRKLEWSGFFSNEPIGLKKGTPAQALEHILNKKWTLNKDDKDQIVMWHRFTFTRDGMSHEIQASLVATGKDSVDTAMAQTVGLPLAIACKLLLQGKIQARGVIVPIMSELYEPILGELETLGIALKEWQVS